MQELKEIYEELRTLDKMNIYIEKIKKNLNSILELNGIHSTSELEELLNINNQTHGRASP